MWKCDMCYPDAIEYGMICDGYSLIKHEGKYHILGGQGHNGDILFTFPVDPWSEPDPDDKRYQCIIALSHKWLNDYVEVEKSFVIGIDYAWHFVEALKSAGYKPDVNGCPVAFVFNKCGKMIEGKKDIPVSVETGHWKYAIIYRNGCSKIKLDGYCPAFKTCGVHEIFYDADGKITGWSTDPLIISETHSGLEWTLKEMLKTLDGPFFVEKENELCVLEQQ